MSPLDTFMFDWFGDTLFNVVVFNLVLIGPASFAAGHAVALTWRPWPQPGRTGWQRLWRQLDRSLISTRLPRLLSRWLDSQRVLPQLSFPQLFQRP